MIAYRDLLSTFIILFSVLSLIMAPAVYFYAYGNYHGYGAFEIGNERYSLGNMGYSHVECTQVPGALPSFPLNCNVGKINQINAIGVNPANTRQKDMCSISSGNEVCSEGMISSFKDLISSECLGKANCTIDVTESIYPAYPPADVPADEVEPDQYEQCRADGATLFVQYVCVQDEETINQKKYQGSIIACLGVFLCLIFMITVYFLKKNSKIKNLEWDVSTITAGDYTVEYKISQKVFQRFLTTHYEVHDKNNGVSIGESLKKFLKKEFEALLQVKLQEENSKKSDQERSKSVTQVKIADIVFAFNNSDLIMLLR
jgi:hypothetical protein